jgi:hypothetical protein
MLRPMNEWVIVSLAIPVLLGVVTMTIASRKGRNTTPEKVGWFLLGFILPIVGLIVALVVGPRISQR